MANLPKSAFQLPTGYVPGGSPGINSPQTIPLFNLLLTSIAARPVPINTSSSVFLSPDKTSMAELKFRELQAQQLAKNLFAAQDEKKMAAPARRPPPPPVAMNPGATLSLPPPGLIPESLVRDILALIKKEYPKAEAVLASKMSKEQFKLFLDELPQLKNIITSRMPVVPATAQVPPATLKAVKEKSGAAGKSAADLEREKKERRRIVTLRFVQLLLQIKKCTEVGLLYEEILNEPMSPMIMSMVHSMVLQVKKLADYRRDFLAGKSKDPEEELTMRKRLLEMREYIRDEQKAFMEHVKKKPEAEHETVEQLLKRMTL